MVPEELRYVPQVKSDIIIQRRNVSLAPIEAANEYTRTGTNTITFNIQGHRELSQLLDTKSMYFTWHCKFTGGYPVEDVANLFEEVIISSNGRVIERIRHAQYIQHFVRGYGMSRKSKARLGKRAGFMRYEDRTVQFYRNAGGAAGLAHDYGFKKAPTTATAPLVAVNAAGNGAREPIAGNTGYNDYVDKREGAAPGAAPVGNWANYTRMSENLGYEFKQVTRSSTANGNGANAGANWGGGSIQAAVNAFDGNLVLTTAS